MSDNQNTEPVKLPKEKVLLVENYKLKLTNLGMELRLIQAKAEQINKDKAELAREMETFRAEMQKEFGFDIAMVRIEPDGTVHPLSQREMQMLMQGSM